MQQAGDSPLPVARPDRPLRRGPDRRVLAFFLTTAILLAIGGALVTSPAGLAFGAKRALALDAAPEETLLAMKVAAASRQRFDIGVFGNSRSVAIGSEDIGRPSCSFFNFSIPGTSFRSSVALLEMLADRGIAPATAIVSLDHLELRMMAPPDHLAVGRLLTLALRDFAVAAPSPREMVRVVWRQSFAAWTKIRRNVSSTVVVAGVERWLGIEGQGQVYRADGSRPAAPAAASGSQHRFTPGTDKNISAKLLVHDIERLAAGVDRAGGPRRIIIYESPLEPENARRWFEQPSPGARALREAVAAACTRLGLECHLGGMAGEPRLASVGWPDATHAPSAQLGRVISDYLGPGQSCGSGPP